MLQTELHAETGKIYRSATQALDGLLFDGMTVAAGGFGLCGLPELLIDAIHEAHTQRITFASNNGGLNEFGLGKLIADRRVAKMICSYVGNNHEFMRQYLAAEIEVEFVPQGTLAERMRAGGAGIPAFFTPTGVGTEVAEGKPHAEFRGQTCVLEEAISADLSIVKAWRADPEGNLLFRRTARNFNPLVASCARVCVAEVEEIVPAGAIDPDHVHLPGIYVQRIVTGVHVKPIERLTLHEEA
ncbi:CoA transferase subunit A [Pararhodobacter oceanensis]|uniref:CoA transferase subunit A n=1 Tax=Pararhodobacter oceanensis TaxID=2172121 RepID=UPI003A902EB5